MGRRPRVRAQLRKARAAASSQEERRANDVGRGVFLTALELLRTGERLPLPVPLQAPVSYVCEILALELARREGLEDVDGLILYFQQGVQERVVEMREHFDVEHFARWITEEREAGRAVVPGAENSQSTI